MNNRTYILGGLAVLLVVMAVSYSAYTQKNEPTPVVTPVVTEVTPPAPPASSVAVTPAPSNPYESLITVSAPSGGATIKSPLSISGQARGTWYFEASFPIELLDASGNTIGRSIATADGEWMTENFVPFNSTLIWSTTTATSGTLILHRDNPSGLPEHDKSVRIPVMF